MCGRYFVDDEMTREIEEVLRKIDKNNKWRSIQIEKGTRAGDIYPGKRAPVLSEKDGSLYFSRQRWGFRTFENNRLIFNARCESVLEKPLFRESILHRRIVVPASWFYEWNSQKEKSTFYRKDGSVLLMAGFWRKQEEEEQFVILTTAANTSMEPVHDRMPLILEPEEINEWMRDNTKTEEILHKKPCLLERKTDYEQISLFLS